MRPFRDMPMRPMSEAEVAAAAAADPDARSMTEEEFRRARKVPRAKTLRRALGLDAGGICRTRSHPDRHIGAYRGARTIGTRPAGARRSRRDRARPGGACAGPWKPSPAKVYAPPSSSMHRPARADPRGPSCCANIERARGAAPRCALGSSQNHLRRGDGSRLAGASRNDVIQEAWNENRMRNT